MPVDMPLSPAEAVHQQMKLAMPPPALLPRQGNEIERPSTPSRDAFTSPTATPTGSPSKTKLPPGARDLPNILEKSLRLEPLSPTKPGRLQEHFDGDAAQLEHIALPPGSPLKKTDKENTPPSNRAARDSPSVKNQAAISRYEPYHPTDPSARGRSSVLRGLLAEDLEKLQLPKVKRLANVTQICRNDCQCCKGETLTRFIRLP